MKRFKITVGGTVQGVGFRPFIYNLAKGLGLKGYVANTSRGVIIEAEGDDLNGFIETLRKDAPPLAAIDSIKTEELPLLGYNDFVILESGDHGSFTHISPDVSICDDCLREMLDPSDRRFLHPFINCTNCGPRYSITRKVPYDRPNTTMSAFEMCLPCAGQYNDPDDRRFHAQPNACPDCGPKLTFNLQSSAFGVANNANPVQACIELLKQGAIVAIKGLGGFHLACDALNEEAVERLREKKRRSNKPFALMSPNVEIIKKYCEVSETEGKILSDRHRPIVLLRKIFSDHGSGIGDIMPEAVAPNNKHTGFMLPYTPLHYLLFFYPTSLHSSLLTPHFDALVMTSGNLSEEPIVVDNGNALLQLSGIADAFLMHDRNIFMRVDDSVVKVRIQERNEDVRNQSGSLSFVRRSRGYVPEPIPLLDDGPDVLGCGADLKNTFTITRGSSAIVGQHIGDMENLETVDFFRESLDNLKQVYRADPIAVAHDLHPGYMSTGWAHRYLNEKPDLKAFGIQHHYAHIASVMAEKGRKDKIIGVALDGTGYGTDGNIWGGEFLVCDLNSFRREGHFNYMPLPGGDIAVRDGWRIAISCMAGSVTDKDALWENLAAIGFTEKYGRTNIQNILKLLSMREFSPLSSGAGRLFDAVSAIMGVCDRNTFEGEAAIALENLACEEIFEAYDFRIIEGETLVADFSGTITGVVNDVKDKVHKRTISTKFHNTVVRTVISMVEKIADKSGLTAVALSGGVFQNDYLFYNVVNGLAGLGLEVIFNELVPCNDGGISLGQAYIARERLKQNTG
jgi:hydrogenase maturation protein HypF